MDPVTTINGLVLAAFVVTGFYALAEPTAPAADAEPVDQAAVTDEPVAELGDWDAASLAEIAADPDPLDTTVPLLAGTPMVDALLFVEAAVNHPELFEWTAPSFTQGWIAAGEQPAKVEVPA